MATEDIDIAGEVTRIRSVERNKPSLSSLTNPSKEFLSKYTKGELQKHCSQLGITGIWTTKDNLIDKLVVHYRNIEETQSSPDTSQERENGNFQSPYPPDLLRKFEKFVRETKDNLYVVNNSLAEKEREIKELKNRLFFAEETIKQLEEALQNQNEMNTRQPLVPAQDGGNILLIGDSSIKEVKPSDLHKNVMIRTLPEANVDLLKSWITEKLDRSLKECIIYCGTQDLLDEDITLENVLDNLGTAVAELKERNHEINVKVCELVPTLKTDNLQVRINQYNIKLREWCNNNGVTLIKTQDFFRLGTGDVDVNCYENQSDLEYDLLNRIGAIRLLDAISSVCQNEVTCSNWKEIKTKLCNLKNYSSKFNAVSERSSDFFENREINRNNNVKFNQNKRHYPRDDNFWQSRQGFSRTRGRFNNNVNRPGNTDIGNRASNDRNAYYERTRNGCYNCGEFNHRQSNCRFDHMIRCNVCYEYGHKSRLCKQNTPY